MASPWLYFCLVVAPLQHRFCLSTIIALRRQTVHLCASAVLKQRYCAAGQLALVPRQSGPQWPFRTAQANGNVSGVSVGHFGEKAARMTGRLLVRSDGLPQERRSLRWWVRKRPDRRNLHTVAASRASLAGVRIDSLVVCFSGLHKLLHQAGMQSV